MITFQPGVTKTGIAPITVSPSGLSCQAELYLGPNPATKTVTSGLISFTSTGAQQSISLPVTMPSAVGTYHVYLDVYAAGILIGSYIATEDVQIGAVVLSLYDAKCVWLSQYTIQASVRVKNSGAVPAEYDLIFYFGSYQAWAQKYYRYWLGQSVAAASEALVTMNLGYSWAGYPYWWDLYPAGGSFQLVAGVYQYVPIGPRIQQVSGAIG